MFPTPDLAVATEETGTEENKCHHALRLTPSVPFSAQAIEEGRLLNDPLELRPLPLSGIPGWHSDNAQEAFHLDTPCYQPKRAGRVYPAPLLG